MLEIAVCDDEIITTSDVEKMLEKVSKKFGIEVNIDIFYDGSTLVEYINKGKKYDIIYMDIEMEKQNGVDAAKDIRKIDRNVFIIYVTSHESFAKEVFEVSTFRFITKPIDESIFEKYFLAAKKEILEKPFYFQYQYNKITHRVPIDEIIYFQSDKRITYIITSLENKKCYVKLNDIEKRLIAANIYFYRTHQSFLVNPSVLYR